MWLGTLWVTTRVGSTLHGYGAPPPLMDVCYPWMMGGTAPASVAAAAVAPGGPPPRLPPGAPGGRPPGRGGGARGGCCICSEAEAREPGGGICFGGGGGSASGQPAWLVHIHTFVCRPFGRAAYLWRAQAAPVPSSRWSAPSAGWPQRCSAFQRTRLAFAHLDRQGTARGPHGPHEASAWDVAYRHAAKREGLYRGSVKHRRMGWIQGSGRTHLPRYGATCAHGLRVRRMYVYDRAGRIRRRIRPARRPCAPGLRAGRMARARRITAPHDRPKVLCSD